MSFTTYGFGNRVKFYFQPTVFLLGFSIEDPLVSIHLGPFTIEVWKFWGTE